MAKEMKYQDNLPCPTCGRAYPAGFWGRTKPKPWRLGVKQCLNLRLKVVKELRSPDDLTDRGAFEVIRSRLLEAVANWVFRDWLDIREVVNRVADLSRWAGRWVWHQYVEPPPVLHRVDHGYSWGRVPEVEVATVGHNYKVGRG